MKIVNLLIGVSLICSPCFAQEISATYEKKDDSTYIETKEVVVEGNIKDIKDEITRLQTEINSLKHERDAKSNQITDRQDKIDALRLKIDEIKKLGVKE